MSEELKEHIKYIAQKLSNPDFKELNEGRDIENEGEFSAFDYLKDALDIEYIVSRKKEYLGARILVTFGGPNIWINTRTKTVEGYWWGDSAFSSFQDNLGLDDALEELFSC